MNKFKIVISSEFGKYKTNILRASQDICQKLVEIIEVQDFKITIEAFTSDNPYLKISGGTDEGNEIWLKLNTKFSDFSKLIEVHLPGAITHEFHHLARKQLIKEWNLLELLVLEGLALQFEKEVLKKGVTPHTAEISDDEVKNYLIEIKRDLFDDDFDHKYWYNKTEKKVPQSFVYRFGFRIVEEYLLKHPKDDAVTLYKEPAISFLPEYLK